ncbi:hypothetical protein QTP70_032418 [Hemibagrus guttatus]|uniref:Uncharacterized protein n=1 Tax=Hemibagrus guttatus TaxID=175788 RepID=A0AAE0UM25_9TELE|nr:hypothetical protein QTP70_032418 [Hemibagrus guttatus]
MNISLVNSFKGTSFMSAERPCDSEGLGENIWNVHDDMDKPFMQQFPFHVVVLRRVSTLEWTVAYCNMKYQKYITVMQMAMGVTASNKDDCIPPKRQLCQGSSWDLGTEVSGVFTARAARVPPSSDAAASSSAVPPGVAVSQGKPSLRRIKGRVHRSKSLDSIDLLDCNATSSFLFIYLI